MSSTHKPYGAPASYEELFTEYFGYIVAMLVKGGIDQARVEDEAMIILTNLIKADLLASYQPDKQWRIGTVNGKKVTLKDGQEEPEGFVYQSSRTAPFMSILRSYVGKSILAARDRQARDWRRGMELTEESLHRENPLNGNTESSARAVDSRLVMDSVVAGLSNDLIKVFLAVKEMAEESPTGYLPRNYASLLSENLSLPMAEVKRKVKEIRDHFAAHNLVPQVQKAAA